MDAIYGGVSFCLASGCAHLSKSESVVNDSASVLSISAAVVVIVLKSLQICLAIYFSHGPSLYDVTMHHFNKADCSLL